MKTRPPIEDAAFGPEAIKVIGQAFDEAWVNIAGNCSDVLREEARLRLASANSFDRQRWQPKRGHTQKRLALRP